MNLCLDSIRSEMISQNEAVGVDVTDGAVVEQYLDALSFNLDRFHGAVFEPDTLETLLEPDEAEMQQALLAIAIDAIRATIALGLRLDSPHLTRHTQEWKEIN